jgi:hypothetical protein
MTVVPTADLKVVGTADLKAVSKGEPSADLTVGRMVERSAYRTVDRTVGRTVGRMEGRMAERMAAAWVDRTADRRVVWWVLKKVEQRGAKTEIQTAGWKVFLSVGWMVISTVEMTAEGSVV